MPATTGGGAGAEVTNGQAAGTTATPPVEVPAPAAPSNGAAAQTPAPPAPAAPDPAPAAPNGTPGVQRPVTDPAPARPTTPAGNGSANANGNGNGNGNGNSASSGTSGTGTQAPTTAPPVSAPAPSTTAPPARSPGSTTSAQARLEAQKRAARQRLRAANRRRAVARARARRQVAARQDVRTSALGSTTAGGTLAQASTGVRPGGASDASDPRADGSDVAPLGPTREDSIVPRVVRDVVEVVPTPIRIALAGLMALVLLLAAYLLITTARTKRLERHRAELLEDIGLLQAALLPDVPARLGALATTVAYRPADGPAAGGDFYDAFALSDGRVGLILGDVSGHGRQALANTTLVRFTVRAHLEVGMSPREALAIAGRSLDERLADDFATVVAAIHDPANGTLTYASAGHPPPLILGPAAHTPVTASSAPPIGAGFPTGQRQTVLPMPEGTSVCLYSDGLLEARIDGDQLGRERLSAWLADLGPDATAKQVLDLVVARADRLPDDLAACVLHAAAGATGPATRVEQLKLDVLDIHGPGLTGFLSACGVTATETERVAQLVDAELGRSGGAIVEVRTGEHPKVAVTAIGDDAATVAARPTPQRR